ncbi:hypothetical protein BGZ73_002175 [Actinomortierella ambigua]|nr:hypothetical protein BGZ73_002175 [Actinomortierella ambigua]
MVWSNFWTTIKELSDQFIGTKDAKDVPEIHRHEIALNTFSEALTPEAQSTALFYHGGIGTCSVLTFQLLDEYHGDTIGLPQPCNMWELQLELLEIPGAISSSINLLERFDDNIHQWPDTGVDQEHPTCLLLAVDGVEEEINEVGEEEGESQDNNDVNETEVACTIDHAGEIDPMVCRRSSNLTTSDKTVDLEGQGDANQCRMLGVDAPVRYLGATNVAVADNEIAREVLAARGTKEGAEDEDPDQNACVYLEEVVLTFTVSPLVAAVVAVAG